MQNMQKSLKVLWAWSTSIQDRHLLLYLQCYACIRFQTRLRRCKKWCYFPPFGKKHVFCACLLVLIITFFASLLGTRLPFEIGEMLLVTLDLWVVYSALEPKYDQYSLVSSWRIHHLVIVQVKVVLPGLTHLSAYLKANAHNEGNFLAQKCFRKLSFDETTVGLNQICLLI